MTLAGCSLADIRDNGDATDIVETVAPNATDNINNEPDTGANDGQDTPDTVNSPTEVINYDGAYAVFYEGYDMIYVIDSYDRMITSYDRTKFEGITSLQDNNLEASDFVGYSDGIFYFLHDNIADEDYFTSLYAVDAEKNEAKVVCHYAKDETVTSVDIYDGKIYVTFYSAGSRDNKFYEDVYTKDDEYFEYEYEEGNQNAFLSKLKVNAIYTNSINSAQHDHMCSSIERTVAEYGFVIAEASGKYERVNSGGSVEVFDIPYSGITVCGYDSRYVAMTAYNEEYYGRYIYCYDMLTDSYYTVGNADATLMGYADGYIYYAEEEGDTYGYLNYHVYKFDPSNGMTVELYDLYNTPGACEINAGVSGFCYIKDHVLFVQCVSGKIGWMAVYYDEAGATYKNLDCPIAEVRALDYGTVTYSSEMIECPFCMVRLMNYYSEIFAVDESTAAGYAAINQYLSEQENAAKVRFIGDDYEVEDASHCDAHSVVNASYVQRCVTDANILSGKYLTVNYECNSYSGGVHGSYETKQYLFNIDSGEVVTIADLYNGTEDEFREFIANKTKEDYLERPEVYYSNSSEAQGVYDSAYANARFSDVDLEFHEDKVILVYQEYEMGPYAAGQIRIELTYQELLGRNRL